MTTLRIRYSWLAAFGFVIVAGCDKGAIDHSDGGAPATTLAIAPATAALDVTLGGGARQAYTVTANSAGQSSDVATRATADRRDRCCAPNALTSRSLQRLAGWPAGKPRGYDSLHGASLSAAIAILPAKII
jgi:hypothetical protein